MAKNFKLITDGLVKNNPTFVLLLGMCPTLATTTSAINGLSMGLATLFVLLLQLLMQAYTPAMYETLGLFIPLIVVNCIVLGRAEAFANKNGVLASACDGIGVGLGFTCALTVLGLVREVLGSGSAFGLNFIGGHDGMLAFVMAPGAFLCLGYLMVLFNKFVKKD